ncbi:MAG: hypothetical protein GY842_04890 [bacterium]|nr:hypothetical protein [bacterium]
MSFVIEDEVIVISTAGDMTAQPVLRVYDVSDLIESGFARRRLLNTPLLRLHLTGREADGAEGPGGGMALQNPFQGGGGVSGSMFERLEELIELIRETVLPETWRESGGCDTVRRQGNRLIVTAGPVVHAELEGLLALLRSSQPRTVDLHSTLVRIGRETLDELRAELASDWPRLPVARAEALEGEQAGEGAVMLRMTTTGPSGRAQLVSSLYQRDYVAGLMPVVDESAVAYQPSIDQANSGVELVMLPALAADGQTLTLEVSLALATPGPLGYQAFMKSNTEELGVQLRSAGMQTLCSQVRLAAGQAVLLTIPAEHIGEQSPEDTLCLLIRPSVR